MIDLDVRVDGTATMYRLYDVGYAIDLEQAAHLFGPNVLTRLRPAREEARALQIRNPPLQVTRGTRQLTLGATPYLVKVSANLFDFGVCSLHLRMVAPLNCTWSEFAEFGRAVDAAVATGELFAHELDDLLKQVGPAVQRPAVASLSEEYIVFRVDAIRGIRPGSAVSDALANNQLAELLLDERRPLSAAANRELMPHRFSYYDDDFTVLTWENALIIEPRADDYDVEFVLEFANAQLLELRLFDMQLDAELPALYERVAAARAHRRPALSGRFRAVLSDLHTRVADITDTVERVENALKVTNDVYLAQIYAATLDLFRADAWRVGIERKLRILRESYVMLNGEAQAARSELLEVAIVGLIVIELVLAMLRHG